jgi:HicB family
MATLSLRMRDDLKRKAQILAEQQGVSLNNYINSVISASVAQEETMRFFRDRLQDIDLAALHKRVLKLMAKSRPGTDPPPEELRRLTGGSSRT